MKKRLLCLMASLLLCGAAIAQEPAYVRLHDNNMPVVAQVVLDEVPVTTSEWTLKAYIGDDQRGEAVIQTSLNNTYWIQVYYSTDTEDNTAVTFKISNANNQEYTSTTTLNTLAVGYGTLLQPQEIDFASTQTMTQTTTLAEGWTWWSTPIELSNIDGLTMLENSLGTNGIRIQSKNDGFVTRFDYQGSSMWYGTLEEINNEQMYKINMSASHTSSIQGVVTSLSAHQITINNGWNWIGFPSNESISVTSAMAGFTPEANDQIKSKSEGFTTYVVYGSQAMWYGTLSTLEPGSGYMYKSNASQAKTFTYQNGRGETPIANITPKGNTFVPNDACFADNMTITAVIELDGDELRSDAYEIAAFAGGECRGSVKLMYVEPLDRYMAFLLVAGNTNESLSFVLTNGRDASQSNDHLVYSNDAIVGTPTEPTVLHFGSLGIAENGHRNANIFPNPVNCNEAFTLNIPTSETVSELFVVNTLGETVRHETGSLNTSRMNGIAVSGVYTLRIICQSGNIYVGKLIVK